jgi:hypothetical protein
MIDSPDNEISILLRFRIFSSDKDINGLIDDSVEAVVFYC